MPGILLDTHTFYWLVKGASTLSDEALASIAKNQIDGTLYVSPVTAWELSIAARKPIHKDRPQLDSSISKWFRMAMRETTAKLVPIQLRIAIEAAEVPILTGHKDPGDCYLIGTSRVRNIPIVTRGRVMQRLAAAGHLNTINC